jgi:uncharacterized protein YkwD
MKYVLFLVLPLFCTATVHAADTDSGVIDWRYLQQSSEPAAKSLLLENEAQADENTQGLDYLNSLRTGAGLISFVHNNELETAARNHADYLVFHNLFSHYENKDDYPELFTGVNPWDRGTYAGYDQYTAYAENISAGSDTVIDSIDGLFAAIYHRFGFLTLSLVDIGIGIASDANYHYHTAYIYDIGNRENTSLTRGLNPRYVVWPHDGFSKAQTSFSNNESPDPLPSCPTYGITGNPVSIEFNPDKNGSITMDSFKLYDNSGAEITDTTILTRATDPGGMLDDNQFVLFPMHSLDVDARYKVVFAYSEDGVSHSISWHFNTTRYEESHYLVTNGNTYDVVSGQTYILQLKPADCTTVLNSYSYSGFVDTLDRLNLDLFRISVTGDTDFSFGPNGEFTFSLRVTDSDTAIPPSTPAASMPLAPILNLLRHCPDGAAVTGERPGIQL